MTQEEVARQLDVSRPTYVQIEGGNRGISGLELGRLAYLFGRDVREFLADSEFAEGDALTALFRAQADVTAQPQVMKRLRQCLAVGHELSNLERLVGIDRDVTTAASYRVAPPTTRWEAIQQGERLADEERRRLGLGISPLPDLAELLDSQGIRTGLVDLPEDVSGLTLSDPKTGSFVVVNGTHPHLRRRFSFAHEYAHVVADRDRTGRISRASERHDLIEVRANAFAATFLMPEEGVFQFIASLGKGRPSRTFVEVFDEAGSVDVEGRAEPGTQTLQLYDVVQLAHHFRTSRRSALFRLRNLRLVTGAQLDQLVALDEQGKGKQIARLLGLPDRDARDARGELRHRFLGLALEAFRRDEISRSKLRELGVLAGLSRNHLDELLEGATLDVTAPGSSS